MKGQTQGDWVEQQSLSREAYYVACRSETLTASPLARRILDRPIVLYRARGRAVAFLDRCPHRNVPLSLGTTDASGCLTCPYHGWSFDADGRLVSIPGRVLALDGRHHLKQLPIIEENGFVWVCPTPGVAPSLLPYRPPHQDAPGYTTVVREVTAPGSLFDVAENALDVPHTAVLHGGLFRRDQARTRIRGLVRRYDDWVETEYVGEPPPQGLVARLLSVGAGREEARVAHFDRFFLPGVLQVEYRLSEKAHFIITGLLTPEGPDRTRLYAAASFRTPLPGRLLALVLEPLGRAIFAQDQRMLARQAQSHRDFGGPQYASTELDTMGPQMRRLLRTLVRGADSGGRASLRVPLETGENPEAAAPCGEPRRVETGGEQTPVYEAAIEIDA